MLKKLNFIFSDTTLNESFLHVKNTEQLLVGKYILDKRVLKTALETLHRELQPDHVRIIRQNSARFSPKDYSIDLYRASNRKM